MKPTLENAKLLATLLGIVNKQNSKIKDDLFEQLYKAVQKDINDQTGIQYHIQTYEKSFTMKRVTEKFSRTLTR